MITFRLDALKTYIVRSEGFAVLKHTRQLKSSTTSSFSDERKEKRPNDRERSKSTESMLMPVVVMGLQSLSATTSSGGAKLSSSGFTVRSMFWMYA